LHTDPFAFHNTKGWKTYLSGQANITALNPAPFYIDEKHSNGVPVHVGFFTNTDYKPEDNLSPCATKSILTIPLVIDPVWSIGRGKWSRLKIDRTIGTPSETVFYNLSKNPIDSFIVLGAPSSGSFTIPDLGIVNWLPDTQNTNARVYSVNGQQTTLTLAQNSEGFLWYYAGDLDPQFNTAYQHQSYSVSNGKIVLHLRKDWLPQEGQITAMMQFSDPALSQLAVTGIIETSDEYLIEIPSFSLTAILDVSFTPTYSPNGSPCY
jgi:hypothetical protein